MCLRRRRCKRTYYSVQQTKPPPPSPMPKKSELIVCNFAEKFLARISTIFWPFFWYAQRATPPDIWLRIFDVYLSSENYTMEENERRKKKKKTAHSARGHWQWYSIWPRKWVSLILSYWAMPFLFARYTLLTKKTVFLAFSFWWQKTMISIIIQHIFI